MSLAAPPPPSSLLLNLRPLADLDLLCGPVSSPSPASPALHRTAFADLLQSRANLHSPVNNSVGPLTKVLSYSPRPLSGLATDARRSTKENRLHACAFYKSRDGNRGPLGSRPVERKRPAKLDIPEAAKLASLTKARQFTLPEQASDTRHHPHHHHHESEFYAVASRRGQKDRMEDSYTASTPLPGNLKQVFFGVFDGHGGKHAAEFAAANLSRHVASALHNQMDTSACVEDAMRSAYRNADAEFLDQRMSSGACAVSVLVKEGEMVVANAGDCKAVLCRAGKAESLSTIHRASNEAERQRVEDLGGFVDCYNGIWRLQGTLAVTRALGDASLKRWVSAEPATKRVGITHDCEFLLLASDGLWDQMSDQEAIDCARNILNEAEEDRDSNVVRSIPNKKDQDSHSSTNLSYVQAKDHTLRASTSKIDVCKDLIKIACQRGNRDDITVMIVPLRTFALSKC